LSTLLILQQKPILWGSCGCTAARRIPVAQFVPVDFFMDDKSHESRTTEIKLCNVVHHLKAPGFSVTVEGVSATTERSDGGEEEFIFSGDFTYDEIVRNLFNHLGISGTPPHKIRKAPGKTITSYVKKNNIP
jgi:hypothetical protein